VALIAVDGKPAKAYAVGARLDGELVLRSVSLRTASIDTGQGQPPVLLELPVLPSPSTGILPPIVSAVPPAPVAAPVPPLLPSQMPGRSVPALQASPPAQAQ
jgi:general secretion pathway protein C